MQNSKVYKFLSFIKSTSKGKFVRNVAALSAGTAIAQLITVAFAPIITRLYGPEAYGVFGVFVSITTIIVPLAALTYPIAIVLPKYDVDAKGLARLSLYVSLAMAGIISLVFFAGYEQIIALLQIKAIAPFLFLIPLIILFTGCLQTAQQWLIRKKQFKLKAKIKAIQAFFVYGSMAGVGLFYPIAAVLVLVYTFGSMLHAGMLALGSKRIDALSAVEKNSQEIKQRSTLKQLAYRYRDFPFYRAPQVFINTVSQGLPVLMLAIFFGPAPAGFYAICKKVLSLPSQLVANSVGDAFYPRINEAKQKGKNLTRLIFKATISLALVGFIPFLTIVIFGPRLFGFILGAEWVVAGQYARWLVLWLFFAFMNRPSVKAIPVLGIQNYFLLYEILSLFLRAGSLVLGFYLFESDIYGVALFSAAGALLNISLIIFTMLHSTKNNKV